MINGGVPPTPGHLLPASPDSWPVYIVGITPGSGIFSRNAIQSLVSSVSVRGSNLTGAIGRGVAKGETRVEGRPRQYSRDFDPLSAREGVALVNMLVILVFMRGLNDDGSLLLNVNAFVVQGSRSKVRQVLCAKRSIRFVIVLEPQGTAQHLQQLCSRIAILVFGHHQLHQLKKQGGHRS